MGIEKQPGMTFSLAEHGNPTYANLRLCRTQRGVVETPALTLFFARVERDVRFTVNHSGAARRASQARALRPTMRATKVPGDALGRFTLHPGALDTHRCNRLVTFLQKHALLEQPPALDTLRWKCCDCTRVVDRLRGIATV